MLITKELVDFSYRYKTYAIRYEFPVISRVLRLFYCGPRYSSMGSAEWTQAE